VIGFIPLCFSGGGERIAHVSTSVTRRLQAFLEALTCYCDAFRFQIASFGLKPERRD